MPLVTPKRNGFLYSFPSFQLQEGAEVFKGLLSFGVNPQVERSMAYGNRTRAYGRTRGTFMAEVSMTFVAEAWFDFVKNNPTFLFQAFDLTGLFQEGSRRDGVQLVELAFNDTNLDTEGTDATEVEITGDCFDVLISTEGGAYKSMIPQREGEEQVA